MSFDFATKIKSLRKSHDLTQEEFAERLGMSSQAVSKWETGTAMPDISMFPILANFFSVTTDELLGVDISRREEHVRELISEGNRLYREWKQAEMVEHYRNAVMQYPGEDELWFYLAWSLNQAQGVNRSREEDIAESIRIFQSSLERSKDVKLINKVYAQLVQLYHSAGDDNAALEWAEKLPSLPQSRQLVITRLGLYKGGEQVEWNQAIMESYVFYLLELMRTHADIHYQNPDTPLSVRERIGVLDKIIGLLDLLYGENKFGWHYEAYECHRIAAALYLFSKDTESALDRLEKAVTEAKKFQMYQDGDRYPDDCLLFKGYEVTPHNHWSRSALADMQGYLTQERYAPLREHPRFVAIMDTLKANTGENA
ncbi:MAG: helix-turn-helix transcriptional regulator [Clostridia bacterium]|nr:helix-turn-helix transcriptional regulator [Clostridia bacterium]